MLNSIDYADLQEDLRQQLNQIAQGQWYMVLMGQSGTLAYEQMDQAYDAVREQFDAIKDGEMQKDNADALRNVQNLQDQIVMAGEATYVALATMELQAASLERQLEATNRTVEEMELRCTLGQVASLQLEQTKAGRAALQSGLDNVLHAAIRHIPEDHAVVPELLRHFRELSGLHGRHITLDHL